jgi:hypothetical protein
LRPLATVNALAVIALATSVAATALAATNGLAAPIIGYHEASDPVKTIGWACSTDGAAPVRIHLFAEFAGTRTLIATHLADERRDDVGEHCLGEAAHAFRFGDYAISATGAALYEASGSVAIRAMVETPAGLVDLPGTPRTVSFAPVGLHDQGLVAGRWRTDLDNPFEGTAATPLSLGECAFATPVSDGYASFSGGGDDPLTGCRYGRVVSAASHAAASEDAWPMRSFWAVVANVEEAFDNPRCADGPPGQSRPIRAPGTGALFGIAALPDVEGGDPGRRKMHLVLNSLGEGDCRANSYGVPYLSFGAQADRGNYGVLTYVNRPAARSTVRFSMTLMDIADRRADAFPSPPAGETRYSQAHLVIEALWGGRKRWLFVELLPDPRTKSNRPLLIDAHLRFNWHLANSFLYPGADYLFKSAEVLNRQCAPEGIAIRSLDRQATYADPATRARSRTDYSIDLSLLFGCLQRIGAWREAPMPAHAVPVTGIHFGIEQDDAFYREGLRTASRAPNAIWIAVDSVRLD